MTYDVIALKFLQFVPGSTKLFNDHEAKLTNDLSEAQLIELFDAVKIKLSKSSKTDADKVKAEEVFHVDNYA